MNIQKIALVGNPNSGKSSVFNQLTGLNQHVGNYPGVTVDKKTGSFQLGDGEKVKVIDLPGIYSVYPKSEDERVVFEILNDPQNENYPDLFVVVVDATNLERNLLLFTQLHDLGVPIILVLNMFDLLREEGIRIDVEKLSELLGTIPVVPLDARKGEGIDKLKKAVSDFQQTTWIPFLNESHISESGAKTLLTESEQIEDTDHRFKKIAQILKFCLKRETPPKSRKLASNNIDKIVTHPIWGYGIFLFILLMIFQAIYELASVPMDLIDNVFLVLSQQVKSTLPSGVFTDLIAEGIVPGIGGVVIFVPQIVLLFAFIAILEETGYMSRVVFIMDRLMRPFGLNGKSVVPLISGVACAIPAIMATRTIDQWKDRLITIMVTPLTSCSARLPVYTLLIALTIPEEEIWGFMNLQGLVLLGMYLLGFVAAFMAAIIFKLIIRSDQKSFLIMEMPTYKIPRWSNIGITLWEKTKVFVWEAGRVIMAISVILWVLASYGPSDRIEKAVSAIPKPVDTSVDAEKTYEEKVSSVRLENSWIGILGKQLEPAIEPLGYDWQVGIALITSFAAREVFVSSMATIYSVGEDFEDEATMIHRMQQEINPTTGEKVYNLASGLSLMVFYAFAMQCMSTLAIVKRETKSWKWPLLQLVYMTTLAYMAAFVTYNYLQ
ncbi:ferrous iron transport protein B [Fulvivirgaceae bacterium BMA10]|uniref:Ferrous iron transport protein B n=1 Tax=Splendidivirga corallicola TaxID=3051826 RepID=A0ABT8KPW7_9BACT|nr:ferrous iron transport protein B [Fulvivirgaceae bacterium BMA10]